VDAIVQERYGAPSDVLRLRDVERPEPGDGEVLVQVRAASVHPDVWHVVTGRPALLRLMGAGVRRPSAQVPGTDMAGVVAALGPGVTGFAVGDAVYGETVRGHQWANGGAFAEFVVVRASALARKPERLSFEQAAAVPTSGYIAVQNVRDAARVGPGQRVLVHGAGGGLGVLAVQLARAYGASVTATDVGAKLPVLTSIGADAVVDVTTTDPTRMDARFDVVVDIPGDHGWSEWRRVLTPEGRYVLIGHDAYGAVGRRWLGSVPKLLGLAVRLALARRLPTSGRRDTAEYLRHLTELAERGALVPVVDRTFPLAEAAAAIDHLAAGRVCGKVVLTV
jgi:NADPH:quinone reductase-like Zn-dependent oxidoreductase